MKEANVNQSSEVCRVAKKIYALWQMGGSEALRDYFAEELEIPEEEASLFAKLYDPSSPPSEVCPLEAMRGNWSSSSIFKELALQLPGRNEGGIWPKNVLAWWILRHLYGTDTFAFEIRGTGARDDNKIVFPAYPHDDNGRFLPLGLVALDAFEIENLPAHILRKARQLQELLGPEIGRDLAKMLLAAGFIFPPKKEVDQLCGAIQKGLSKKEVILTGAFCPDYSFVETGDPMIPYKYTFEGVANGVGLVAQQFVRVLPFVVKFMEKWQIRFRVKLSIGDFEANSPEILRRVGLDREGFILKCMNSLQSFREALPSIPMELCLFEKEWANGRWNRYVKDAYRRMSSDDFGDIKKHTGKEPFGEVVKFIARSSRNFYHNWYNREMGEPELIDIVLHQGAEYAAMGRILAEDFGQQPIIQIAGDRPKMQAFNSMYSNHPTLCTRRTY